jgi:hypothetical protein
MDKKKLLKLAKMVLSFEQTETDKGVLVHEGDLEVGTEVFIEDEQGELQPAEDGEYLHEEEIIIVAEGKVAEIREVKPEQPEEQPAEDPEPEKMDEETEAALAEKDARIAELEAALEAKDQELADKDTRIGELEAELEDLKAKLAESDARSAEEELKMSKQNQPKSKVSFNLYK